ncbi:LysM peptidoglycan-binding domain-containing protein [Egibacter rhizosphaerae]|uniref:LysM peptidoglycan-binding domain-containing protein n=1 Tax=Egibacter rhizosphaerae TaxID=1670831 RepID=A0A411YIL5_9ACTN|nr:transglycosylase SLT domain-containing protein [Egibacter rhizosphaerae]QBI20969.1 LysM peptidoglycan-binding domain-containing protein [Egibacter rhizosphaerae]
MPRMRPRPPSTLPVIALAFAFAATAEYTVEPGDTLSGIAAEHGVSPAELAEANDLADHDLVLAGTTLRIPEARPGGSGASAPGGDGVPMSAPPAIGDLIERTAHEHGWSPAFVKAVAWQESGWQQQRVSSAGAVGIMQVMPGTGTFVSTRLAGEDLDLADSADNVRAGVLFLDHVHDLTGGDVELTLAGYYQGLASVERYGKFDDTRAYIDNVLALRERFR